MLTMHSRARTSATATFFASRCAIDLKTKGVSKASVKRTRPIWRGYFFPLKACTNLSAWAVTVT